MKKLCAFLLTLVMSAVCALGLATCNPGDGGNNINPEIDTTKTQLYIGIYDGGYGTAWAREVATDFEAYYANTSFEEGKTGVQVMFDPQKTRFDYGTLIPNLQTGIETSDVYLTAASNYYRFVLDGVCEDISDIMKENIYNEKGDYPAEGEEATRSIFSKMDPYYQTAYEWKDGKFYGFPFEDGVQGLIYDADLFKQRNWEEPETMEDFYELLDRMVTAKITPFTWTGANDFYFTCLPTAIVAQYEGIAGANQNLFYNGEFEGTPITEENGYLLAGQQGKLEALKFLRKITSDTQYYSADAFKGSQSHLLAQSEFIGSVKAAQAGSTRRIAMLLDGDWWENEARKSFDQMSSGNNAQYAYGKRDFRFLPMPRIEGQKSEKRVLYSFSNGTIGFVNKSSGKKELAKLWVKWMHQNSQLAKFTTVSGGVRPFDYTLTDEGKASMTKFAQSYWDVRHDPDVEIFRTANTSDYNRFADMPMSIGNISTKIGNETYSNPMRVFKNNPTLTAEQYFEGSKAYYNAADWKKSYDKYYAG